MLRPSTPAVECNPKNKLLKSLSRSETIVSSRSSKIIDIKLPKEPDQAFLRQYSKLVGNQKQIIQSIEKEMVILLERIKMQEEKVSENQETIEKLFKRISDFSDSKNRHYNKSEKIGPDIKRYLAQISEATAVEFLKSNPLMLDSLISVGLASKCADVLVNLPKNVVPVFFNELNNHFKKFQLVFGSFCTLSSKTKDSNFFNILRDCVRVLYDTDEVFVFSKNTKSGFFECNISGGVNVVIKDSNSFAVAASKTQQCLIVKNPSESEYYSPAVDMIFNPTDRPLLVVPISDIVILYILMTDVCSSTFKEEDASLGILLAQLIEPITKLHLSTENLDYISVRKQMLSNFEQKILRMDNLKSLVSLLNEELKKLVGATEMKILFVNNDECFTLTYDEEKVIQNKHPLSGITKYIVTSKTYIFEKYLDFEDCDQDEWCLGRPFIGFPIENSEGDVLAVIEMVNNKCFNEDDLETILICSPPICLAFQRSNENSDRDCVENAIKDLKKVRNFLINNNELLPTVIEFIPELISSKSVAVFIKDKETDEIYKKLSVIDNDPSDKCIVGTKFVEKSFDSMQTIFTSSVTVLEEFEPLDGYVYKSFYCTFCEYNGLILGVYAANPVRVDCTLHESHNNIIQLIARNYFLAEEINKKQDELERVRDRIDMRKKVHTLMRTDSIIPRLIKYFNAAKYAMYILDRINATYIPMDFTKTTKFENVKEGEYSSIKEICLIDFFNEKAVFFPIFNDTFIIFVGNEIEFDLEMCKICLPSLIDFAKRKFASDDSFKKISTGNQFRNRTFDTCIDIYSESFPVDDLVLKIFRDFNIEEALNISTSDVAVLITNIKSLYKEPLRWRQSVEVQYYCSTLMKKYCKDLKNEEIIGCLITTLVFMYEEDSRTWETLKMFYDGKKEKMQLAKLGEFSMKCGIRSELYYFSINETLINNFSRFEAYNAEVMYERVRLGAYISYISRYIKFFCRTKVNYGDFSNLKALLLKTIEVNPEVKNLKDSMIL